MKKTTEERMKEAEIFAMKAMGIALFLLSIAMIIVAVGFAAKFIPSI